MPVTPSWLVLQLCSTGYVMDELVTVCVVVSITRTLQRHSVGRTRRSLLWLRFRGCSRFDCFIRWTDVCATDWIHHGDQIGEG